VTKAQKVFTTNGKALRLLPNPYDALSVSSLRAHQGELDAMISRTIEELNRLTALRTMVIEAYNRKPDADRYTLRVSDHAIVRYLERFQGDDMDFIRGQILELVDAGRPEVAVRDGTVVTVLPEGASSIESYLKDIANG
jgi:hypothetical protein